MNRKHIELLKFLFLLNSITLFLYFCFHPQQPQENDDVSSKTHIKPSTLTGDDHLRSSSVTSNGHFYTDPNGGRNAETPTEKTTEGSRLNQKPWPILPSYLPWTPLDLSSPTSSCEGYFGNGFNHRLELISPSVGSSNSPSRGWFRCFYSETLRSSICEAGNIRMVPDKVKVSKGGEELEEVMGRGEEDELPHFEEGAFEVLGEEKKRRRLVSEEFLDSYLPSGGITRHTMRGLIRSIQVVGQREFHCDQWVEEPTLMVTRFEYANLFHTVTDWYSAYVAARVTNLPYQPHVVFVDGHCRGPMEETWRALFSSFKYAKHFSGSVCYHHAVFVPLGYETALFRGLSTDIDCNGVPAPDLWKNPNDQKTARLSEFGEMIRTAFGFHVNRHEAEKPVFGRNVLFVRREDYLAHPRHSGRVESRLSNEQEVFDSLQIWASNHQECKVNLINGLFAHMSMKDQVQAIQEASVIIGAHGAGLTHIVSATPKTVVLEIISSYFRRPHFQLIAKWKGLEYHAINLHGSYISPEVVVDKLNKIMKSLRC